MSTSCSSRSGGALRHCRSERGPSRRPARRADAVRRPSAPSVSGPRTSVGRDLGAHADQRGEHRRHQARAPPHSDHRHPTQHDRCALDDEGRPRRPHGGALVVPVRGSDRCRLRGCRRRPRRHSRHGRGERSRSFKIPVISSRLFADARAPVEHPWLAAQGRARAPCRRPAHSPEGLCDPLPGRRAPAARIIGSWSWAKENFGTSSWSWPSASGFASASTSPASRPTRIPRSRAPMSSCCRRDSRGYRPCSSRRSPSRAGSCRPTARAARARYSTKADGAAWCRAVNPSALADAINAETSSRRARPRDAWMRYEVAYAVERYIALIGALAAA